MNIFDKLEAIRQSIYDIDFEMIELAQDQELTPQQRREAIQELKTVKGQLQQQTQATGRESRKR